MAMMARTAHAVPDVHMLATPAASRRSNVTAQRPSVTGAIIITSPVPSRATEIPRAHAYAKLGVITAVRLPHMQVNI
jgi:hypothetical protein